MDKKKQPLKRYRLKINPLDGAVVDFISQVEFPAIEVGFLKFNNQENIKFTVNNDKMELFGPALIPNIPIYRNSPDMGEYEVYFTAQDVKDIQMNFMKSGFQNNVNLDHSSKSADSFVFESFVSDELVPNPAPFSDLPLGTWFVRMKVEDPAVWNDIKAGKRNGFSIEGVFEYMMCGFENHFLENQKTPATNITYTQEKITLKEMLKSLFKKVFMELAEEIDETKVDTNLGIDTSGVTTNVVPPNGADDVTKVDTNLGIDTSGVTTNVVPPNGADDVTNPDAIAYKKVSSSDYKISSREVGQKVETVDANMNPVPAPDGAYEFEDGFEFVVKDGMIVSIDGQEATVMAEEVPQKLAATDLSIEVADFKAQVASLQNDMDAMKHQCSDMQIAMATKASIEEEMKSLKDEFRMVFEKFTKIPAEVTKINTNKTRMREDEDNKIFQQYLMNLRK